MLNNSQDIYDSLARKYRNCVGVVQHQGFTRQHVLACIGGITKEYSGPMRQYTYCVDVQHAKRDRALKCVGQVQSVSPGPFREYVQVGSNACAQLAMFSGCTNADSLYTGNPGDVAPDPYCTSLYKSPSMVNGLLCVLNPPDPNFVPCLPPCPPCTNPKTRPICPAAEGTGSHSPNKVCADVTAEACNCSSAVA